MDFIFSSVRSSVQAGSIHEQTIAPRWRARPPLAS
jgi:hypothetical protein